MGKDQILCDICGTIQRTILATIPYDTEIKDAKEKGEFKIVRCRNCGLIYALHQFDLAQLETFYQDKYRKIKSQQGVQINDLPSSHFIGTHLKHVNRHVKEINRLKDSRKLKVGSILDVGCATGHFLQKMRDLGWKEFGIDPHRTFVKYGREELNVNIQIGMFEKLTPNLAKFNCITMYHVLHHVKSPYNAMKFVYNLLNSDGFFIAEVPNLWAYNNTLYNFSMIILRKPQRVGGFKIPHLFYFNPKTAQRLIEQSGFKVDLIYTVNVSERGLFRFFQKIFSQPVNGEHLGVKKILAKSLGGVGLFVTWNPMIEKVISRLLAFFGLGEWLVIRAQKKIY